MKKQFTIFQVFCLSEDGAPNLYESFTTLGKASNYIENELIPGMKRATEHLINKLSESQEVIPEIPNALRQWVVVTVNTETDVYIEETEVF